MSLPDLSFPSVPDAPAFQLFGLGTRPTFFFSDGALRRASDGALVHKWRHGAEAEFRPDCYRVELGGEPIVWEDAEALWWRDGSAPPVRLAASERSPTLPDFRGHPHAAALRALHAELLCCFAGLEPVPNPFVYPIAWRRDAAMAALALARTGNLALFTPWARTLSDPFDRNNGCEEPDNLGETLFLLGSLGLADSPLAARCEAEARRRLGPDGALAGTVDGHRHAVYAACWLRFGLEACGRDFSWVPVPDEPDVYGTLFWMRREWVGPAAAATEEPYTPFYPYLWWARAHFRRLAVPAPVPTPGRPLSWEQRASAANYAGLAPLSPAHAAARLAAPHAWHAAEQFLLLLDAE